MTDNEAFEAWAENEGYQPDYLSPSKGNYRDVIRDIHEAWNAALAYLRSQGEPVAWMHGIGAHRFFSFSKDYIVDVSPAVPLYLTPVAKVPEWQPIETAPKDGSEILCWPRKYGGTCYWQDDVWHKGWVHFSHRTDICEANPVMWMPLPSAPEYKEE